MFAPSIWEDALDTAISMAQPGDEVVLSPACSSFDEFDSFEHRGKVFKQLVAFISNAWALGCSRWPERRVPARLPAS